MKVTVCKGCGQRMHAIDMKTQKPACTTCIGISSDSGIPIEVEVPDTAKCYICKKETKNTGNLPFYDSENNTYYCGCRGWE